MNKTKFGLEENIGYLIGKTFRVLQCAMQKLINEKGYNITVDQWVILVFLSHKDGQMQVLLSRIVGKDKTSITRIIDDLEKKNYVRRVPNKSDRREKDIFLTNTGRKFIMEKMKFFQEQQKVILDNISSEDYEIFKKVIKKVMENIVKNKDQCSQDLKSNCI
jgi:DNA-binding MarR family transcriptional regulator